MSIRADMIRRDTAYGRGFEHVRGCVSETVDRKWKVLYTKGMLCRCGGGKISLEERKMQAQRIVGRLVAVVICFGFLPLDEVPDSPCSRRAAYEHLVAAPVGSVIRVFRLGSMIDEYRKVSGDATIVRLRPEDPESPEGTVSIASDTDMFFRGNPEIVVISEDGESLYAALLAPGNAECGGDRDGEIQVRLARR